MCGIAGLFGWRMSGEELTRRLQAMNRVQRHRGPDDEGTVCFEPLGAGLGCARLSIVDLERGQQPMANEDRSVHAVLNGEIYNHQLLRKELAERGHRFRSRCDTEVLVHLYEECGDQLLERLSGMFGLAILDTRRGRLLLARDGPGMKPLYLAETPEGTAFASEVRALFAGRIVTPKPDFSAMDVYLATGYVPAPLCLFQGVRKLEAGQALVIDQKRVTSKRFWLFRYRQAATGRSDEDYEAAAEQVLEESVRSHLAADVPVGVFLSGGWDSSLVAAFAARLCGSKLKTFSIIFPDSPQMDESGYSRLMSKRLESDHSEIEYRHQLLPQIIPGLIRHLEEPCAAAPSGLTYLLSSLAARHVKTVLSGEGADELFGGYEWMRINSPYHLRRVTPKLPFRLAGKWISQPKLRRALRLLGAPDERLADLEWRRLLTPELKRSVLKPEHRRAGPDMTPVLLHYETLATCTDRLQRRLAQDFSARLTHGILFMTDKASMAHSLEIRLPFLDRAVIDFAAVLPTHLKIHRGREKRILARLARKHLPPEIACRRKHGLGYPKGAWSEPPLVDYLQQMLLDGGREGPFCKSALEKLLRKRTAGEVRTGNLAALLYLQCWWNEFIAA
jgi:asparagine synthase (glutamine-hydrolysing)